MVQRAALLVASLAAALSLAVGLALAGFAPAAPANPGPAVAAADASDPTPAPTVRVDTVYVAPPAKPEVVTVKKVAKPAGGEHEGDHEGGDDD